MPSNANLLKLRIIACDGDQQNVDPKPEHEHELWASWVFECKSLQQRLQWDLGELT